MPLIIQRIRNDGPNPGNTQIPGGLLTASLAGGPTYQPFRPGSSVLAFTTCANLGGDHSATLLSDSEGNAYQLAQLIVGSRASINTSQVLAAWFCPQVKGLPTPPVFHQQFVGGDTDYQAFYALELTPSILEGGNYRVQNAVPPGPNAVSSAAVIPTLPGDLMVGFAFNVSELSPVYVATPGEGMTLLDYIWPFFEPGGPNVCVATRSVVAAGSFRVYFTPPAGVPDYWQTMCTVLRDGVTPPDMVLTLTPAQLAAFNAAGGEFTIKSGV